MTRARAAIAIDVLVIFGIFGSVGCATTVAVKGPTTVVHRPPRQVDPSALHVAVPRFDGADFAFYDGNTGKQIAFDEVVTRARAANVVIVGEQHDQPSHHELQRRVVATLGAEPGLAVGFEMLTWPTQPALDRFSHGELTPQQLADEVNWSKAWGFAFSMYEPIFADAQRAGARVYALNPPRDLVRAVRRGGVEKLPPAERSQVPELDMGDDLHRAWFEGIIKEGHPVPQRDLDGFYRAQVLWDESMAEGAVKALDAGAARVVVLCGVGHVAFGRGVPQRVERRRPDARVLSIVPLGEVDWDNVEHRLVRSVALGEGDILVVPKLEDSITL